MTRKTLFLVPIVSLALSPLASSGVMESYESYTVGAVDPSGGGGTIVDSGPGITDGLQATRSVADGSTYDKIADVNLLTGAPAGTVFTDFQIDVYGENVNQAGYLQVVAGMFFGSDSSFNQINGSKELDGVGGDSFLPSGTGDLYTITYTALQDPATFAKINAEVALDNFVGLGIYLNKDAAASGTFTVDNIRFNTVPEPASLVLLGLGGAALLGRRKSA